MLHTPSGRIVTLQTMKSLEEKLPSDTFIRVHRSFIVNLKLIELLESNALIVKKKKIPIGKNYKDELFNIINQKRL
jgi:DNA-binding LytR/AlgR family response regulator